MKTCAIVLLIGCMGVSLSGCADLVVPSVTAGPPVLNLNNNNVELPFQVEVKNQGTAPADEFKVSVHYTGTQGTFVVAYTVPNEANIWCPRTDAPLAPGDTVTFDGKLTFHPLVRLQEVSLLARADSCAGDELMPIHCRVSEAREGNNDSSPVVASLP